MLKFNKDLSMFLLTGDQASMSEFSSIYQASEDLMDHCVLAETNGNFQEAIRHCSQAIGINRNKLCQLANVLES